MGIPANLVAEATGVGLVETDLADIVSDSGPDIAPRPYFFLVHRPEDRGSWDLVSLGVPDPGHEGQTAYAWVPAFQHLYIQPGAAGMKTISRGDRPEDAWAAAVQHQRDRGAFVLPIRQAVPQDFCPPGVMAGPLVRAMPVKRGRLHCTIFDAPRLRPGRAVGMTTDELRWALFRLHLVEIGVVAPPISEVIEDAIERYEERLQRTGLDVGRQEHDLAARLANIRGRLGAARRALVPRAGTTFALTIATTGKLHGEDASRSAEDAKAKTKGRGAKRDDGGASGRAGDDDV